MSKKFEVNTKLDFLTYVHIVDSIVSEFFDSDGEYCPHIGRAYVMKLFYDQCVKSEGLRNKIFADMDNIAIVNILSGDEAFMRAFNDVAFCSAADTSLTFENAYSDAMNIVDDRRSSMARATDMLEKVLRQVVDRIASSMTEENLAAVRTISSNMTGGESTAKAIVDHFATSPLFEKILHMKNPEKEDEEG